MKVEDIIDIATSRHGIVRALMGSAAFRNTALATLGQQIGQQFRARGIGIPKADVLAAARVFVAAVARGAEVDVNFPGQREIDQ